MKRRIIPTPKESVASPVSTPAEDSPAPMPIPAPPEPRAAAEPASAGLSKYWFWIVLLLVFWQPLQLGFYMDDWAAQAETSKYGAPFGEQLFKFNFIVDLSRPGLAVIRYLASSILGDKPFLWQLAMLLVNGLIAVLLAHAAQAIAASAIGARTDATNSRASYRVALSVSFLWLLFPWSTSSQFWSALLPQQLTVALFAYLIIRIFSRKSPTFLSSTIDGLIYLWICVSYEAFYGQFAAIALLCVALVLLGSMRTRAVVFNLVSLGAAQALAIGWYFTTGKVTTAQREIYRGWKELALLNLTRLVPQMGTTVLELRPALYAVFLCLLAYAGWILWQSRQQWAGRARVLGSALIALACLLGVLASVVAFSLGLRPMFALGVENRTYVLLSFWLVLLIAVAALALQPLAELRQFKVLAWLGLICGVLVGLTHTVRTLEWATAWTRQQEILRNVPVDQMQAMEADATVVMINPLTINQAPIFAAPWDINHALPLTYPTLRSRWVVIYAPQVGPIVWDGNRLAYPGQEPLATTRDLYLWIPAARSFRRAERPFQIGVDLRVTDLQ
jgi:hypothetical protein